MSKPVPLTDEQIQKIIQNRPQDIQEAWELFINLYLGECYIDDKLVTEEQKNEIQEGLDKTLGIQDVTKRLALYRNANLVSYNDEFFELLEALKSGDLVKFRDGKGKEWELPSYRQGESKKNVKLGKPNQPKPPDSKMGRDALGKLTGSGG